MLFRSAITLIIHGGASGADRLAGAWANQNGVNVVEYKARWKQFGKGAGPIRNRQMLDEGKPDLVVAFKGDRGTANMIKQADDRGVKVIECF